MSFLYISMQMLRIIIWYENSGVVKDIFSNVMQMQIEEMGSFHAVYWYIKMVHYIRVSSGSISQFMACKTWKAERSGWTARR